MQTAIIAWLYVVGLGVSYCLFYGLDRNWQRTAIIVGWPITVPLVLVAKHMGWIDRVRMWAEMTLEKNP